MEVSSLRSRGLLSPTGEDTELPGSSSMEFCRMQPLLVTQQGVFSVSDNPKAELETHMWHPKRGI